jgi:hypothetical protein
MQHIFRFVASRFGEGERWRQAVNDRGFGEGVVAWLRGRLTDTTVEADIGEPVREGLGSGFWLELGDDRFWIFASLANDEKGNTADAGWLVCIEASEPHLALRPQARTRRQTRMDGLVVVLRTIITSDSGLALTSEEDD